MKMVSAVLTGLCLYSSMGWSLDKPDMVSLKAALAKANGVSGFHDLDQLLSHYGMVRVLRPDGSGEVRDCLAGPYFPEASGDHSASLVNTSENLHTSYLYCPRGEVESVEREHGHAAQLAAFERVRPDCLNVVTTCTVVRRIMIGE